MKKQIIIIGIVVILITVGLSGCNQQQSPSLYQGNGVEILSYNVTTHWSTGLYANDYKKYFESGFYHNIPEDVNKYDTYYNISGVVKNNAGKLLSLITIDVILYDVNGNELCSSPAYVVNIPNSYIKNFSTIIYKEFIPSCEHFDNVEKVGFSISTM